MHIKPRKYTKPRFLICPKPKKYAKTAEIGHTHSYPYLYKSIIKQSLLKVKCLNSRPEEAKWYVFLFLASFSFKKHSSFFNI